MPGIRLSDSPTSSTLISSSYEISTSREVGCLVWDHTAGRWPDSDSNSELSDFQAPDFNQSVTPLYHTVRLMKQGNGTSWKRGCVQFKIFDVAVVIPDSNNLKQSGINLSHLQSLLGGWGVSKERWSWKTIVSLKIELSKEQNLEFLDDFEKDCIPVFIQSDILAHTENHNQRVERSLCFICSVVN